MHTCWRLIVMQWVSSTSPTRNITLGTHQISVIGHTVSTEPLGFVVYKEWAASSSCWSAYARALRAPCSLPNDVHIASHACLLLLSTALLSRLLMHIALLPNMFIQAERPFHWLASICTLGVFLMIIAQHLCCKHSVPYVPAWSCNQCCVI